MNNNHGYNAMLPVTKTDADSFARYCNDQLPTTNCTTDNTEECTTCCIKNCQDNCVKPRGDLSDDASCGLNCSDLCAQSKPPGPSPANSKKCKTEACKYAAGKCMTSAVLNYVMVQNHCENPLISTLQCNGGGGGIGNGGNGGGGNGGNGGGGNGGGGNGGGGNGGGGNGGGGNGGGGNGGGGNGGGGNGAQAFLDTNAGKITLGGGIIVLIILIIFAIISFRKK
jgi:hypothetical protein